MIKLTRYDQTEFVLNSDIIQYVEKTPDTIVTLITGDKIMVKESVEEITASVVNFKKEIFSGVIHLQRDENAEYIE